jgi:hypothetical protein
MNILFLTTQIFQISYNNYNLKYRRSHSGFANVIVGVPDHRTLGVFVSFYVEYFCVGMRLLKELTGNAVAEQKFAVENDSYEIANVVRVVKVSVVDAVRQDLHCGPVPRFAGLVYRGV